jgi:DNA-binding transcriptional ArsR family regulator
MSADPLSQTFAALADPTRRAVIARLIEGPASVSELAEPFDMALPSLMQHLKVLETGGLIRTQKTGRVRTCRLETERLGEAQDWLSKLAEPFDMSLPAVSKHLKVLERAGLVTRGREAQWRPCRLEAGPLKDATGWLERYRQFWEQSLDRLEDYLDQLQMKNAKGDDGNGRKS